MKIRPRGHGFTRHHSRRRMLQTGIGGGLLLASPFAVRAQGDNTRGDESDPTPDTAVEEVEATEVPDDAPASTPAANVDTSGVTGGLFPDNRVLLYYGFPENPNMGILGEYSKEELLELLKEQAAEYEAADPSKPVILGIELIASVAQGSPGPENLWIADTGGDFLTEYVEFTAANDMVLFLDVQMGFKEPYEDYIGLERWMIEPHVHLGIDPEFHMRGDEQPGIDIGQVTAEEVIEAQNYLAQLSAVNNLPRKSLIVHQFHHTMIEEKEKIVPMEGVDLIIDMDGFGSPEMKEETYAVVNTNEPIEYNGIKLFYKQDVPLMTAAEVLTLDPSPDLIIYQ